MGNPAEDALEINNTGVCNLHSVGALDLHSHLDVFHLEFALVWPEVSVAWDFGPNPSAFPPGMRTFQEFPGRPGKCATEGDHAASELILKGAS
jgi:hypothetical protein